MYKNTSKLLPETKTDRSDATSRRWWRTIVGGAAGATLALAAPAHSSSESPWPLPKLVAVAEDLRNHDPSYTNQQLDLAQRIGVNAVRIITTDTPYQADAKNDVRILRPAIDGIIERGMQPIVTFTPCWNTYKDYKDKVRICHPPLTASELDRSATTISQLAGQLDVKLWEIGNEPNNSRFWRPQFDASGQPAAPSAYTRFLARSYDELKKVSPDNQVICGALASVGFNNPGREHTSISPLNFIADMGLAYKKMGRTKPICDVLGLDPYGKTPTEPPGIVHSDGTIGLEDTDQVLQAWAKAFKGTAQPAVPIFESEYGIDTAVPPDKLYLYDGKSGPRASETQASLYYSQALGVVACNPNILGIALFKIKDETRLSGWQSGEFYPDATAKSSLPAISQSITKVLQPDLTQPQPVC